MLPIVLISFFLVLRDIKCSNILVDANRSVKLADFGLAKITKMNDIQSLQGSVFWMAPEVCLIFFTDF